MSPRKSILRELRSTGSDEYKRPSEISGFGRQAPKYREAVNGLLRDQLISGKKDDQGNLVIALNARRLPQVQKELRPWFAAPTTWGLVLGLATLVFFTLFG